MTPIEEQIEGIVDSILEDYRHGRSIDKMDLFQQPDKAVIIDMIGKLMRIIYPGSARDRNYRIYNARHNLSMLIEDVMYNLNKQIAVALRCRMEEAEAARQAQEISLPQGAGRVPDRCGSLLPGGSCGFQRGGDHLLLSRSVRRDGIPSGPCAV